MFTYFSNGEKYFLVAKRGQWPNAPLKTCSRHWTENYICYHFVVEAPCNSVIAALIIDHTQTAV